ncbi:RHS repeat-associated core domain-containing protein [Luteibacter yeojuensis]|uniref:RHS repeat-associated core domain-containing protein n=1 Tax=Luteibacter yeojuensis TaxID=345309 RepID=A0A7X5QV17_9GAMM|nr:RHS repeat-associated core domain-containing protein [Luteibacter yeojuensis]
MQDVAGMKTCGDQLQVHPFGQRSKYIAGQTTVSLHDEAGHWLGDYDGAGRPIRQVAWLDDLPLAAIDGNAIRDIQTDHLGTPRVVIDRTTDKAIWTWSIVGDAFGSDAPNEDPDGDGTKYVFDMRFPGQRYDAVTKLFQNGWRDYDPLGGRYIQSDPIGLAGGISTYAYVGSNPYARIDPTGLFNLLVGGNLTFIPAGGGGVGGGFYLSYTAEQGLDFGVYGSVKGGIGAEIGAGLSAGYVPGDASNISGTSLDASISGGVFSGTVGGAVSQPTYASYSVGLGIGLPAGASLSATKTSHASALNGLRWVGKKLGFGNGCD